MIDEKFIKDLEEILNGQLDPTLFPFKKGNSIRIGKYIVRSSNDSHKVFDCETNTMVADLFSKSAAVALAKTLAKGYCPKSTIINIDKEIQKHFNDCVFYKNTLSTTTDTIRKDITAVRLDISKEKTSSARRELDKYIYSS
tara:strand:+ start:759 stop:1181 length:423 start_codon:yes stop_codon:yes gene_type:complete